MGYRCLFVAQYLWSSLPGSLLGFEFFLWEAEALRISFSDVAWVALRCV